MSFNPIALYNMLDGIRVQRGLRWYDVAQQAGVTSSTLSRMRNGRSPDVRGLAKICKWAGLDANYVLSVADAAGEYSVATDQTLVVAIANDSRLTQEQKHVLNILTKNFYAQNQE